MRVKLLTALFTLFSATGVYAYCANSYEVARDAGDVERTARSISFEATRYGMAVVSMRASSLASSARMLESASRGSYNSCAYLRSQYSRVSMDYRSLQQAYQFSPRRNGDLSWDMQRLAMSFQQLSMAVRTVRPMPRPGRRYDPPRRYPRRVGYPPRYPRRGRVGVPPRHPRRGRVGTPTRRHRRVGTPTRRHRRVGTPTRRHRPAGTPSRRASRRHNRV